MSQKWTLYKHFALLRDFPEHGLLMGGVVTTVELLESPKPDIPNGYCVEVFNAIGENNCCVYGI